MTTMQHKRVVRIMRGDNAGRTGEVYWSGRDMFGKPNLGVILEDGEKAYVPEKHTEPTTESPETTEQRRKGARAPRTRQPEGSCLWRPCNIVV